MTEVKKQYKEVAFKNMKIGDEGECWGDELSGYYQSPTWIKCKKDSEYGVIVLEVNHVEKYDGRLCVSKDDTLMVEI